MEKLGLVGGKVLNPIEMINQSELTTKFGKSWDFVRETYDTY